MGFDWRMLQQPTDDTSPKVCNADPYSICMIIGMRYQMKAMCIEPNQENWSGADEWDFFSALGGSPRSSAVIIASAALKKSTRNFEDLTCFKCNLKVHILDHNLNSWKIQFLFL